MKVLWSTIAIVLCLVSCGPAYDLVIPVSIRGDWENVDEDIYVAAMSDDIRVSFYGEGLSVSISDLVAYDPLSYSVVANDTSFSVWHLYRSSEGFSFTVEGEELVMTYALHEGDELTTVSLERQ